MAPSTSVTAFRDALRQSKSIIAVAGAGLSAASGMFASGTILWIHYILIPTGIPTFRTKGGYWKKYNPLSLATPEAFAENPSLVWQFYHYRRAKYV